MFWEPPKYGDTEVSWNRTPISSSIFVDGIFHEINHPAVQRAITDGPQATRSQLLRSIRLLRSHGRVFVSRLTRCNLKCSSNAPAGEISPRWKPTHARTKELSNSLPPGVQPEPQFLGHYHNSRWLWFSLLLKTQQCPWPKLEFCWSWRGSWIVMIVAWDQPFIQITITIPLAESTTQNYICWDSTPVCSDATWVYSFIIIYLSMYLCMYVIFLFICLFI